jgi:hypothetical protein
VRDAYVHEGRAPQRRGGDGLEGAEVAVGARVLAHLGELLRVGADGEEERDAGGQQGLLEQVLSLHGMGSLGLGPAKYGTKIQR